MTAEFSETNQAGTVMLVESGKRQTIRLTIGADGFGAAVFLSVGEALALKNLIERALIRAMAGQVKA